MNEKYCMDCFYYELKYSVGCYCNCHNKELGEWGFKEDICDDFKIAVFTDIDVSGTGYETEIRNVLTGEQYGVKGVVKLLNELYYKKEDLKDLLVNSQTVTEQKELQKIIYKMVIDLIDDKLKEAEKDYEMTYEDYLNGQIEILKELKKDLKGLC